MCPSKVKLTAKVLCYGKGSSLPLLVTWGYYFRTTLSHVQDLRFSKTSQGIQNNGGKNPTTIKGSNLISVGPYLKCVLQGCQPGNKWPFSVLTIKQEKLGR